MKMNKSIKCTVGNCKYNVKSEGYCSLDVVKIGTHEANPTECQCTDCNSFVCDSDCCRQRRAASGTIVSDFVQMVEKRLGNGNRCFRVCFQGEPPRALS